MNIIKENIVYRKLEIDEIPLLVDYRIIFLKELQGDQPIDKERILRNELLNYFEKAFKENSFIAWIAELQSNPVGFGGMVIHQIPGNFKFVSGWEGYILSMYTVPEYRKHGIAREILDRLVKEGRQLGLGKINLHAAKDGIGVYQQYGFKEPASPFLELF